MFLSLPSKFTLWISHSDPVSLPLYKCTQFELNWVRVEMMNLASVRVWLETWSVLIVNLESCLSQMLGCSDETSSLKVYGYVCLSGFGYLKNGNFDQKKGNGGGYVIRDRRLEIHCLKAIVDSIFTKCVISLQGS